MFMPILINPISWFHKGLILGFHFQEAGSRKQEAGIKNEEY
jgi:hypothetical protein